MDDTRWQKIYQWKPYDRRRRGRPEESCNNKLTDFMRSRNMAAVIGRLGTVRGLSAA